MTKIVDIKEAVYIKDEQEKQQPLNVKCVVMGYVEKCFLHNSTIRKMLSDFKREYFYEKKTDYAYLHSDLLKKDMPVKRVKLTVLVEEI